MRDTSTAAMIHSSTTGMSRAAPKDSNQAFLRMMSDHHQGLVVLADSALAQIDGGTAKSDAQKLRQKQGAEQRQMLGMLTRQYGDSVMPMIMSGNQMMIDSVVRAPGAASTPTFYQQVIAPHREGVQMREQMLPHMTGEVKRMAEKSVADQRREMQEFERKASGAA